MTPNLPDTQKHVGFFLGSKEDFLKAGATLLEETGASNVLITCGADGMVVVERGSKYSHIPVFNKSKVFDVTGAGDTVVASFTLALASGASVEYASIIGNLAASIVIRYFGCHTITLEDLKNELRATCL